MVRSGWLKWKLLSWPWVKTPAGCKPLPRRSAQGDRFSRCQKPQQQAPVLHVNTLEFLEGNENGSILQEEG
jgi:hypothetical protein